MDVITTNRKARHDYHIIDTLEVGIVLVGSEVKSLRDHKASLVGSYVSLDGGEVFVVGMHIDAYDYSGGCSWNGHIPTRTRKLLMHRREVKKFAEKSEQKGFTIIPLKMYFNDHGIVKLEIAVVQGKKHHDKRQDEKKKQAERDMKQY
tara:strand:+ start:38 stop:481 length:444 start_codon:yes stop_codon:yes gene_type:complete